MGVFIYFNIQIIIFSEYATKMQKKAVLYYIYTKPTIIPSMLNLKIVIECVAALKSDVF